MVCVTQAYVTYALLHSYTFYQLYYVSIIMKVTKVTIWLCSPCLIQQAISGCRVIPPDIPETDIPGAPDSTVNSVALAL